MTDRELIKAVQEELVMRHNELLGSVSPEAQAYLSDTTEVVVAMLKEHFNIDLDDQQIFDKVEQVYLSTWHRDCTLQKIKALKKYRDLTGCGLREAKEYIENQIEPAHEYERNIERQERERLYKMTGNAGRYL